MEYAVSAYLDAGRTLARAHCEYNQRSLEMCVALFEAFFEPVLAMFSCTDGRNAITSITQSHNGTRSVIVANFGQRPKRG